MCLLVCLLVCWFARALARLILSCLALFMCVFANHVVLVCLPFLSVCLIVYSCLSRIVGWLTDWFVSRRLFFFSFFPLSSCRDSFPLSVDVSVFPSFHYLVLLVCVFRCLFDCLSVSFFLSFVTSAFQVVFVFLCGSLCFFVVLWVYLCFVVLLWELICLCLLVLVCLCVCVSVCLCVCVLVSLIVCVFAHVFYWLCAWLIGLFVCACVCLSVGWFVCMLVYLIVCLIVGSLLFCVLVFVFSVGFIDCLIGCWFVCWFV